MRSQPTPDGSPILGIVACFLVAIGLLVTMLGGNQGGLVGMPGVVLGLLLGAIAWGRGLGKVWGQVAVITVLAFVGFAMVTEFLRAA